MKQYILGTIVFATSLCATIQAHALTLKIADCKAESSKETVEIHVIENVIGHNGTYWANGKVSKDSGSYDLNGIKVFPQPQKRSDVLVYEGIGFSLELTNGTKKGLATGNLSIESEGISSLAMSCELTSESDR